VAPALVLPFDPSLESEGALLAAQALLGTALGIVSVAAATHWRFRGIREALSSLGLRRFKPSAIGWMFVTMFAYYVFVGLFSTFVLEPQQDDIGGELGVGDDSTLVAVLAVVLIAGLAPFAEELFFRGFFFSGLRSRLSFWPAALVAGLVFGAVHAATGITTVIPLAALGFGLCWLYEKTGSLWPCVILHAINNGLALALIS
jgi:membrane protease YdiL (CAAX protease family)